MSIGFVDEVGDVLVGGKGFIQGDEFGTDQGVDRGHEMRACF